MSDEEDQKPTLRMGILVIPMVTTNFSFADGSNPYIGTAIDMANRVMDVTTEKILGSVKFWCEKQGITYESLSVELMHEMAKTTIGEGGKKEHEVFTGVVVDDKPITDQDAVETIREGRSIKN